MRELETPVRPEEATIVQAATTQVETLVYLGVHPATDYQGHQDFSKKTPSRNF
jgi:hypothetical protein